MSKELQVVEKMDCLEILFGICSTFIVNCGANRKNVCRHSDLTWDFHVFEGENGSYEKNVSCCSLFRIKIWSIDKEIFYMLQTMI